MLRHHPSESSASQEPPASASLVVATGRTTDTELEHYLRQIESHLIGVPSEIRASVCREMCQHLTEQLAAHRELGTDPEEALRVTLQQFGKAETIAYRFKHAWAQAEGKLLWTGPLPRWITGVALLWLFTLPLALMMSGQQPITRDLPVFAPVLHVLVPLLLLVLPIASGVIVGRNHSYKIGRRLFNTALLLTLPVFAVALVTGSLTSGAGNASPGYYLLEVWILGWILAAVTRHGARRKRLTISR